MKDTNLNFSIQSPSKINKQISTETIQKVELSLLKYVYSQQIVALVSSIFCASIVFIGLHNHINNLLYIWAGLFLCISAIRLSFLFYYKHKNNVEQRVNFWRNVYIIGALFGGLSWGISALILFPYIGPDQQMLLILMLAGVTAGSAQLSAAVPLAAKLFLLSALLPFIIIFMTIESTVLHLFNFTMCLYLVYSIILIKRTHSLIYYSTVLTFENDVLLRNLESMNIKLESAATHDPLTKVSNRRLFTVTLNNAMNKAKRYKEKIAVFFLDLDGFKKVNDQYGHDAGDQILLTVTERLREYFRKEDVIARLGGDEFAIIIENIDEHDLTVIGNKICQLIKEPIMWKNIVLNVSVSIGVAIYPDDGTTEVELLQRADKSMYAAKARGGNDLAFYRNVKSSSLTQTT